MDMSTHPWLTEALQAAEEANYIPSANFVKYNATTGDWLHINDSIVSAEMFHDIADDGTVYVARLVVDTPLGQELMNVDSVSLSHTLNGLTYRIGKWYSPHMASNYIDAQGNQYELLSFTSIVDREINDTQTIELEVLTT